MIDTWTKNFETENRIREKKEQEKSEYKKQNDSFSENIENSGNEDPLLDDFPF